MFILNLKVISLKKKLKITHLLGNEIPNTKLNQQSVKEHEKDETDFSGRIEKEFCYF